MAIDLECSVFIEMFHFYLQILTLYLIFLMIKVLKWLEKKSSLLGKKSPLLDLYLRDFLDYFRKSLIFHLNILISVEDYSEPLSLSEKEKIFYQLHGKLPAKNELGRTNLTN